MPSQTILPIAVVAVLILLALAAKIIWQYERGVVFRFGKLRGERSPGLNFIIPFVDRLIKVDMRVETLVVEPQEVITRDNAIVAVDGIAFYQVLSAPQAAYQVSGLENAILNLTMTNIRSVMGSMDLDELLSNDRAVMVIEWADRMGRYPLPAGVSRITIAGDGDAPRTITISEPTSEALRFSK